MADQDPVPAPGYKTTEFWLSLAAKLLGVLFATGVLGDGTPAMRIAGIAAAVLAQLGYTVSRGIVKAAIALLLVGALAGPQLACGARAPAARAAGAFIDCQAPNLAPLLPDAIALVKAAVLRWISGSGTVSADGLKADASPLRTDLGRCAFDAAVAALAQTGPAPAPGAPAAAAMSIDGPRLTATWASIRVELAWPPSAP